MNEDKIFTAEDLMNAYKGGVRDGIAIEKANGSGLYPDYAPNTPYAPNEVWYNTRNSAHHDEINHEQRGKNLMKQTETNR